MQYNVISADDHIDLRWLPPSLWQERLPAALRDRAPSVVDTDSGKHWQCEGTLWGLWAPYGSGLSQWALDRAGDVLKEGELRTTTPDLRLSDMDRDGVDASVLYGPTDPLKIADPELRRASYEAYNDWLVEFCANKPERLIGAAQLSMEDPLAARDELLRMAKLGMRHFNVLAARAEPPVYDPEWEPFWDCAEETGLAIGFHLAVETGKNRAPAAEPRNRVVDRATRFASNHPGYQLIEPIAGLIFTGVLDRHPDLKLVMAESGLAWIPNFIQAMDRMLNRIRMGHEKMDGIEKLPDLLPSEYFPRQIWMTFQDDFYGIKMLNVLPEDKVMWASDYPHPASTWPDSQGIIEKLMDGIAPAVREKVLHRNARGLYGLYGL
jgi:predicted TIM-barrel fold metal-dependent hydrolase